MLEYDENVITSYEIITDEIESRIKLFWKYVNKRKNVDFDDVRDVKIIDRLYLFYNRYPKRGETKLPKRYVELVNDFDNLILDFDKEILEPKELEPVEFSDEQKRLHRFWFGDKNEK